MFWAFLGSIAGAALSSRSAKKAQQREMAYQDKVRREQQAREDTKIQRMADDAEKAGLNPVTALRSGAFGGGGYQAPVLSSFANTGSGVGSMVASAFAMLDGQTPAAKDRERLELKLLDAQVRRENQIIDYYGSMGRVPQATLTEYGKAGGGQLSSWEGGTIGVLPSIDATPDGRYHRGAQMEPERQYPAHARITVGDETYVVPNPEVSETGMFEYLNSWMLVGPQAFIRDFNRLSGAEGPPVVFKPVTHHPIGGHKLSVPKPRKDRSTSPSVLSDVYGQPSWLYQ